MVDLVKIRKKAKEKKKEAAEREAASAAKPEEPVADTARAVMDAPPEETLPGPVAALPAALEIDEPEPAERAADKLEQFRARAGRQREEADGGADVEADDRMELLTFMIAGEVYAIDIENIAEIIASRVLTPVPNAPAAVQGIISLRGTIVTMLDLRRELGHPPMSGASPEARTIVVEDGSGMAGFVVDKVLRVVKLDPAAVKSPPIVAAAEQTDAVRGVFQSGSALTILLDVKRLLGH
ncbi:MAG TPA: chemotaxis protein CheW [Thermoanaerobaculia bacterium]|nr:chemotaxis protein CheW [Thermoanaerobaculia bacterium]